MWASDSSPLALAVSLLLHVAAILAASTARPIGHAQAQPAALTQSGWTGDTFDVELVSHGSRTSSAALGAAPRTRTESAAPEAPAPPEPGSTRRPAAAPAPAPPEVDLRLEQHAAGDEDPPAQLAEPGHAASVAESSTVPQESVGMVGTSEAGRTAPAPSVLGSAGTRGSAISSGEIPAGSYGAVGPAGGVRDLAQAFTRALPAAAMAMDTEWHSLPWGPGPQARITITLGEGGKLVETKISDPQPPKVLATLLRRTQLLLQRGQFALPAEQQAPGEQAFLVRVELSRRRPSDDPFVEPQHIMRRGFTAPTPERPGHAFFTFASGRHIDLSVSLVDAEDTTSETTPSE